LCVPESAQLASKKANGTVTIDGTEYQKVTFDNQEFLIPFFHYINVYQLEESRNAIDFGTTRSYAGTKTVSIQVSGSASGDSALTTGDDKATLAIDTTLTGMNLVAIKAYVSTVSSSGAPLFQVRRSRRTNATTRSVVDMLSTGVSIDANEFESADATTGPTINTSNDDVQTGDILLFDCDTAGTGTKGATILLTFQLP
jgi:hypothetical protein